MPSPSSLPHGSAPRPVKTSSPAGALAIAACPVALVRKAPIDLGVRLNI